MAIMVVSAGLYNTTTGIGVNGQGSNFQVHCMRDADMFYYDFTLATFSINPSNPYGNMIQPGVIIVPGEYYYLFNITTWEDGRYSAYIRYIGSAEGNILFTQRREFSVVGGNAVTASSDVNMMLRNAIAFSADQMNILDDAGTGILYH